MFHFSVCPEGIPHATGIEKWEMMAAQAGNDVSSIIFYNYHSDTIKNAHEPVQLVY